jgi:serine/threonine-protein kinase RsbW
MDWLIDLCDPQSTEHTLSQLDDHLCRHVALDDGVGDAVRRVRSALSELPRSEDGPLRLHLDWRGVRPRVVVSTLADPARLADAGLRVGVPVRSGQRNLLDRAATAELVCLELGLERRVQETFDDGPPPMTAVNVDPQRDGMASVVVALAAAAEAHPTAKPAQTAAMAGAALADVVAAGSPPDSGRATAELLVATHRALGSNARVLSADDSTVEIAVSRCPFGPGITDGETLCHVSTGLAGRLGARVNGTATVVLAENIAAGDEECHLQVWLNQPEEEVRGERHRWPPTAGNSDGPAPHLDLSLNLPRESGSVPVVRRLAAQALRAFGVTDDDIHDVELAISEACGNVIDHAADTDTYEVKVELAADRCAITVVDQGGGFDATAVPERAEQSAETGRGLALMRALVDNVAFQSEPQAGAVVHMVKGLRYDTSHPLWRHSEPSA